MADQVYQSLYRRYRPQRFDEVRGQEHVSRTLRNAVRDERVAHAYLFSGPRGTGKTSTARILAKALNCAAPTEGEPCDKCDSCAQVQAGTSLDVHELDAASNNGVDAMRDLTSRAALGTPGRWKVYIVDEVHMLSTAASNALLKTLEEPPAHVVFVLATTDPQKVLPTIRSRTQHFEFRLLTGDTLSELLREINGKADLGVADEAIALVMRKGAGSARDALSLLDQVAAAGITDDEGEVVEEIVESLCERDAGRALMAVAQAVGAGRDPRRLSVDVLDHLRNGFLALMSRSLLTIPDVAVARVEEQAKRLGAPALVRAMEVLGDAMVDIREAIDPRITLEVALVRIARPEADTSPAALVERIERLERATTARVSEPARAEAHAQVAAIDPGTKPATTASAPAAGPASASRAALGAVQRKSTGTSAAQPTSTAPSAPAAPPTSPTPSAAISQPAPTPSGAVGQGTPSLDRDELTKAWGDLILEQLPQRARARYRVGRFTEVNGNVATFALPNQIHRDRCEEVKKEVERALAAHLHRGFVLKLIVDNAEPAAAQLTPDDAVDITELADAAPVKALSVEDRLREAFPGAEEVPQ